MKRLKTIVLVSLIAVIAGSVILIQQTSVQGDEEAAQQDYIVRKPPASMDAYYPPKAEGPQYLFAMYAMDAPLVGFMTHLQGGNMAKAMEYFAAFKIEYAKMAKMVPEWSRHYWPEEPIDNLSAALKSGDPGKVRPAMGGLMQACIKCHDETMPAVWARYQKSLDMFAEPMMELVGPFSAVMVYLTEGEFEKARGALKTFRGLMDELSESCGACHDTERAYYVSSDIQDMLKSVADTLEKEKPNVELAMGTMQKVGHESCYKCHKVHMPTSSMQKAWRAPGSTHSH